jgi:hypothetical protein
VSGRRRWSPSPHAGCSHPKRTFRRSPWTLLPMSPVSGQQLGARSAASDMPLGLSRSGADFTPAAGSRAELSFPFLS